MGKIFWFLSIVALSVLSSCRFYKSTSINSPILKEKGEAKLEVALGSSTDVNASYSLTDNIAMMASYGNTYDIEVTSTTNGEETTEILPNNKYEGALGYYSNINENYYYNAFAGYALGHSSSLLDEFIYDLDSEDEELGLKASFKGPFIQSAIHLVADDKSAIGLIGRLNYFTFSDFESVAFTDSISQRVDVGDNTALIGQLGLDLKIEGKVLGGGAQLSYTFHDNKEPYFTSRKINAHVGIFLKIDALFK